MKVRKSHDWHQYLVPAASAVVGMSAYAALRIVYRRANNFAGKSVLITGGSRGLGLEIARVFAREGARVAICARTAEDVDLALCELRGITNAMGLVCDVTSQNQVEQTVDRVIRRWGSLDVLVNNAGIIQVGPLDCMTLEDFEQAIDTHFWGPLHTIQAAIPHMRRAGGGRIVNISSIGGRISVPHLLPYSASKFALVGLSEGLRAELAADGIAVTTVCPGLMRTGSPRNAFFKGQHQAEYAWFSISDAAPGISISSRRAARQIVEATRCRRGNLTISLPAKIAVRLNRLLPGLTANLLSIAHRLLPGPAATTDGDQVKTGAESFSAWSPSVLTMLNERAAIANNEIR